MTTLGRREKCLRNRSEKGYLRALRAHPMRNRPLPRRRWKPRGPTPPKNLYREVYGLYKSWNLRVKTEIPVDWLCQSPRRATRRLDA